MDVRDIHEAGELGADGRIGFVALHRAQCASEGQRHEDTYLVDEDRIIDIVN